MYMYKRIIQLIEEFSYKSTCSLEDLSEKYQVSLQTIRNDIQVINGILKESAFERILIKNGSVICPENFTEIKRYINNKAAGSTIYSYHLSKSELSSVSVMILLFEDSYVTINQLSEKLGVGRTTFINNSSFLREYADSLGLNIHSSSNKGLILRNTETERRNALIKLIIQLVEKNEFLLNLIVKSNLVTQNDYRRITGNIIFSAQNEFHFKISSQSFDILNYYLQFLISRLETCHCLETLHTDQCFSYSCAKKILLNISEKCGVSFAEAEALFLSYILERYIAPFPSEESLRHMLNIQLLTNVLTERVSLTLGLPLTNDFQLFENLSSHLLSIYVTSISDKRMNDPVLYEIQTTHPDVVQAVRENVQAVEVYFQRSLNNAEITYIAIHICAAIERYRFQHYIYRVIVACNAGAGTSQLIQARLSYFKNIHVVRTVDSWEISSLTCEDADLLISSVPLYQSPIEYVNISGMVTNEDMMKVSSKIREMYSSGKKPSVPDIRKVSLEQIIDSIRPIIFESLGIESETILRKIKNQLCGSPVIKELPRTSSSKDLYLYQFLTPEFIRLDISCRDWKEALRKAGEPLLKKQFITDSYIEEIIDITDRLGPYYIIADGVALPHASLPSPEESERKAGMSLLRLSEPVAFGPEKREQVAYIILLSVIDKKKHLRAVFSLIRLLEDPVFKKQLNQATSAEEIFHLIYSSEISTDRTLLF